MSNNRSRSGIFKRILILYGIVMACSVIFTELYITDTVRENHIDSLRRHLVVEASLIAHNVPFRARPPLDSLCRQFKQESGARVTLIAENGIVLGDSETESTHMENHGHRQEIQQASMNGTGMAIRFSDTLKYDFLYLAIKTGGSSGSGFVRLSMPLKDVDAAINLLRIRILSVVLGVLISTGLFSLGQIERIRRLTGQIRDFAGALAQGQAGKKLFLHREGEFDEIAESLNTMSDALRSSIAAHEEEQHRLNVILRNIPDALFILDTHGTIMLSSVAARKLFGEIAFSGRPFIEVVRNKEFVTLVETVRRQERTTTAEVRLESPLEQYCVVQVSPLFYNERELSGFVAIFHDITRLKRLEQTRKDFVANISHEIKTPITAIRGFAETLLEGAMNDRENRMKFLETIKSNSERINSLVDDLMVISKIELGVIRVEKTAVDFREIADHVKTLLRDKAAAKNISLETTLPAGECTVEADRDRLIQILTNLADNAIKFTESGSVTIGQERQNGRLCLFVRDTGIGIAHKHLPRLGERFYRVDPGRSRGIGGTGLGLAIVKHLVKAHEWDMEIESTPGKGTKVKILIG